jgi:hypothetical protein
MSILNDLILDVLRRGQVNISDASFTIGLETNKVRITGEIPVMIVDTEKPANPKTLANLLVPVQATIEIKEVTFPVPTPK